MLAMQAMHAPTAERPLGDESALPSGPAALQACNLSFLFCVPLTLYYKANGRKKPSFYKDGVNKRAGTNWAPTNVAKWDFESLP